ncbi:MAG: hypothetical protein U0R80_00320 [Nocardioidaceae bacterium]
MIRTVRCRRCGRAIEAFIDVVPGMPSAVSRQAIETKIQAAQIRHADTCPAGRVLTSAPERRPSRPVGRGPLTAAAAALRRGGRRLRRLAL